MASLMFRSKSDNHFYTETKKPKSKGTWYVFHYDLKGKKIRQRIGPNKRIAEIAKGDIEGRLAKQRGGLLDPDHELKRNPIKSFEKQLADYLQIENKAPKTITRYCGVFRKFCHFVRSKEPHIKYLDQIDTQLVERYKDFRRKERISSNGHPNAPLRQGVSVRTLNNELSFLQTLFNLAKGRGFVQRNPLEEVRKINGQKRKKYQPLTKEQIEQLLEAADDKFRPILLTFFLTGMRTGELLNLEWEDIDFSRNEIHIRVKQDWQPKDKEERIIPLHHQLDGVLCKLKTHSDSRYVFGRGENPCPNKLLIRLQRTCRRAGLPQYTIHNLRDEFASHLVMQGVGIETVCQLLGHSSIEITWNHYVHLAPQRLKDAVETLSW